MAEFEGFDVVRRGCDRAAADAYLAALQAGTPVGPPEFAMVRRGYDPAQVAARIAALTSLGGAGQAG